MLFYGDNLAVLRGRDADGKPLIPDESIDLIYLDPPFNSAATYNVLFRAPDGKMSDSQLEAFEDSWHWGDAAAAAYAVPIVGGHTNCHSPYNALSVAVLGRAKRLITSFNAQPGDLLLVAADFRGQAHPTAPFWNAATTAAPQRLRADLELLPQLAEAGLCDAGKDISMGGIVGTLLMLLETSGCGAILDLQAVPCPKGLTLERWLVMFPSYGFLLSVRPEQAAAVQAQFQQRDLVCSVVGSVQAGHQLWLQAGQESALMWDLADCPLTGFGNR